MELNPQQTAEYVGLIGSHQASLRAFIISLMPGVDGVSDVLQETNLVLWEKRAKYQAGTNFGAWAFTIARLEVKSHRKRMRRAGLVLLDDALAESLAEQLQQRHADQAEESEQRLGALENCLSRLSDDQRELVEHRYYSESNLADFAERCGRPVESLRVSLVRIRAALRKCIASEINLNRARS